MSFCVALVNIAIFVYFNVMEMNNIIERDFLNKMLIKNKNLFKRVLMQKKE